MGIGKDLINSIQWLLNIKKIKIGLYKIRSFCSSKSINKKMKRQVADWEKMFIIHVSIKDSYSEYLKELYGSITKRQKNLKMNKPLGQSLHNKTYPNNQ